MLFLQKPPNLTSPLKKLFSQTAIYGLSSIVARFLNYLLVPLYTAKFTTDQYGIVTDIYAYVAFLIVLLTYGMETTYFRFSSKKDAHPNTFSTIVTSIITSTSVFLLIACLFSQQIATLLKYPNNHEFVIWFAFIVGLDAISSIPLARLRKENRPWKFVFVNFANVITNIGLNLFFLVYCMGKYNTGETNYIIDLCYNPELGVSYVFISNLVASTVKFLLLSPMLFKGRFTFKKDVFKSALLYGSPLLIAGLAGMTNEVIDKIMLKFMLFDQLGEQQALSEVGIYGACYKISIIITLFIQAFRYAAEPFFFNQSTQKNAKITYARVMHYFIILCCFIFLSINGFMHYVKYFIPNQAYWSGLKVVPILLAANICLGIYYNLAIWFKLTEKTIYAAYIGIFGAAITLIINYLLIPEFSYLGSAWATFLCYFSMCIACYFFGRKHFPIPYKMGVIFFYLALTAILFGIITTTSHLIHPILAASITLILFIGITYFKEFHFSHSYASQNH